MQLVVLNYGNTELGESTAFIVTGNKPACFLRGDVSSSLHTNTALKPGLSKHLSDIKSVGMLRAYCGLSLSPYNLSWNALK